MGTAFVDGRVFVGNGKILEHANVVVENDKIVSISNTDAGLPENTQRIPIGNSVLFPGFIDCHVHTVFDSSSDPFSALANESAYITTIKSVRNVEKTIRAGITTVRDMGGKDNIELALKQAINSGLIKGPRMLVAGRIICMTGGHGWTIGREADGPDGIIRAVREQLKVGADHIKLMATGGVLTAGVEPGNPQLGYEEMKAGVKEAHKAGKMAAAHAMGSQGIMKSLHAGIDSIEHGVCLTEEAICFMKENSVFLVPTIAAGYHIGEMEIKDDIPAWMIEKTKRIVTLHKESLKNAHEAGVLIGMGTDAGTPFNYHGKNLMEIPLLVRSGLSPMEALMTATYRASQVIGMENQIGTIEQDKLADLVLVRHNPLDDIDILNEADAIALVMQGGKILKDEL
ncbi:MAG: amidohydrolase family protein [Desulfobacteraceae bacterium]|nr:amidohydrolase family protein [Desulfobacteraceae bacterium]